MKNLSKLGQYWKGIASALATAIIILSPILGAKSAVIVDLTAVAGTVAVVAKANSPKA